MSKNNDAAAELKPDTRLTIGGRDPFAHHGYVNTPVYHASTLLYPTAEDYLAHRGRYSYGRRGTPTSEALENAIRDLEGPACAGVALLPSGLADRQRLRPNAQILRHRVEPARDHHDLLRPADRCRHFTADAAEHPRRIYRISRLALV